jgi:hypothetical protein
MITQSVDAPDNEMASRVQIQWLAMNGRRQDVYNRQLWRAITKGTSRD